jgi:hypothetical protein
MPKRLSVKDINIIAPVKKRRGRPPKAVKTKATSTLTVNKLKRRGRPPKVKVENLPKKKEVADIRTPQEKLMEEHSFYSAAKWIESNIDSMEEAYLRKTAKKHGLTMLQNIMDHMLGYFSVRGSELGKAIRESRKHT